MNFQKVFSAIGAVAIGLSLTAGAAFAAEKKDSTDLSLKVECSKLSDIKVYTGVLDGESGGAFAPIDIAYNEFETSTAPGDIKVRVDVGCNFGAWQVDAQVSRFQDGSIFKSFPGEKFSLEFVDVTASHYDGWGIIQPRAPHGHSADFEPIRGFPIDDAGSTAPIFHTDRKSVV